LAYILTLFELDLCAKLLKEGKGIKRGTDPSLWEGLLFRGLSAVEVFPSAFTGRPRRGLAFIFSIARVASYESCDAKEWVPI
jgi:hypothetical protein